MAIDKKNPPNSKGKPEEVSDLAAADLQTFAREYDEDRKVLRWSFGLALLFHVVLFLIHLPEVVHEVRAAEKPKVTAECDFTARNLATHKFAVAAWSQGFRHGRTSIALKGDVRGARLADVQRLRDERLTVSNRVTVCVVGGLAPEQVGLPATAQVLHLAGPCAHREFRAPQPRRAQVLEFAGTEARDVAAEEFDRARARAYESRQQREQRGFSAAAGSEQDDELALADLEVHAGERAHLHLPHPVSFSEPPGDEHHGSGGVGREHRETFDLPVEASRYHPGAGTVLREVMAESGIAVERAVCRHSSRRAPEWLPLPKAPRLPGAAAWARIPPLVGT